MESDKIMARYHVRADGSMGVCTAREGNCPFGGDAGTKHFTSESEARSYSEKIVAEQSRSSNGLKRSNGDGGSKVSPTGGVGGDPHRTAEVARNLLNEIDVQENLDNQDEVAHTYRVQGNVITFIGEFEEDDQPPHYQFDLDGVKTKDELKSKLCSFLDGFDAKHQADVDGAYMEINGVRHYNDELLAMYEADEDWLKGIASKI